MDKPIICKELHTFWGNNVEVLLPSAHESYGSKKEFKKKKHFNSKKTEPAKQF